MPPLEAPHGPAKKKVRKAPSLRPETAGNPNVAPRRVVRAKPAPAPKPTRTQIRSAHAQEQGYKSQGKAVKRVAKQQQTTARAKSTERGYRSQGQQVERSANVQKKAQRLRYLRAHRATGLKFVTKASNDIARAISHNAVVTGTGGGPNFTKLAPHGKGSGVAIALAPHGVTLKGNSGAARAGRHLFEDVFNTPAQTVASTVDVASAAFEAAHGDTKHAKRIIKSVKQSDPIYNTIAAGVEEAGGDTKTAKRDLQRAGKSVVRHPGFAAGEVLGAKGLIGRGGGRLIRGTGKTVREAGRVTRSERVTRAGERIHRVASTKRAPKTLPGTHLEQRQEYSRDIIDKGVQVANEARKRRKVRRLNKKADRIERTQPQKARELRGKAAAAHPNRMSDHEVARQMVEQISSGENIRRVHRAKTHKVAKKAIEPGRHAGAALSLTVQRITSASKDDLRAYAHELEQQHDSLGEAGQVANETLRRQIQKAIDGKINPAEVERAVQQYRAVTEPLQRKLVKQRVLAPGQEDKAKLIPYAIRHMGATHDEKLGLVVERKVVRVRDGKRVVTTEKTPLHAPAIRAHMRHRGVGEPGFVSQTPNMRGAKNFNIRGERAQTIANGRRTGEATRGGTFDAHPEALPEQAVRMQGLVDATKHFRKTIKRFGMRDHNDKLIHDTRKKIFQMAADHNAVPGNVKVRPIKLNPWGASKEQLDSLLEQVDAPEAGPLHDAMLAAVNKTAKGGQWALIPEPAAKVLEESLRMQGGGALPKTLQLGMQAFRRNVLSTSPSKVTGDVIEGATRALVSRSGPVSYVFARRVIRSLKTKDGQAAEEALSRILTGGSYGLVTRTHIHRGAETFAGTKLEGMANALGKFWRAPGPKQIAGLWHAYTTFVLDIVSNVVESQIQTAMLGRALRESSLMDPHLVSLSKKAVDDAANGLLHTPNQIAFGRAVDDMFGQYNKLPPKLRFMITTYTPFIMWAINAVKFVVKTMPKDHPIATGLIAAAENADEEWRKQHGLDLFIKGALPNFLQGSIPRPNGAHNRINRYTPFGAFPLSGTIAGEAIPLASPALAALDGLDWTGQKIEVTGSDGKKRELNEAEKFLYAAKALGEGTVPFLSTGERVKSKGVSSLNPVRDTPAGKGPGGGGSSGAVPKGITFGSGSSSPGISFGPGGSSSTTINP